LIYHNSFCVRPKQSGKLWSTNYGNLEAKLYPPKSTFSKCHISSPDVGHFLPGHAPPWTFPPFLCCYMRIDQALDNGITFSVSMVEKCSKHQIFLCYNFPVLSLIRLHNTSNKGQLSKSLNSQLLKKSCGRRRQNATQSAVFAAARKVSAIMQFIGFCFLYVAT